MEVLTMTTAAIYQPAEEKSTILGLRSSAIFEIVAFLGIMLLCSGFFGEGNRFWNVEPHPFWVIVLLVAVQYGTGEGILAAMLSSVALLIGNMPEHDFGKGSDMYAYLYEVLHLPVLWLMSAVILGELRQRHIREREYLIHELHEARSREDKISDSYNKVKGLKERLELKIASQLRASVHTYRAARAIEKNNPADVLLGVQELVRSVMQPEKFSLYLLGSDGLSSTMTSGWQEGDKYQQEFTAADPLFKEVIGSQHVLCVANRDHQRVLQDQGVLAGPLVDAETGEISGMLKIEKIGFMELNLSTIETFHAICEWVGMALVNAHKYQDAKSGSMVNPDHNLMTYNYFRKYTDYISALGKRVGFAVHMIVIQLVNAEKLTPDQRVKTARTISEAVKLALRNVDMAFDYQKDGAEYSIVLPATSRAGAKIVLTKLEDGIRKKLPKNIPADFALTIHTIHEA
jgi:hypothetical protein